MGLAVATTAKGQELNTAKDSLSYAIGQDMARAIRSMNFDINEDVFQQAILQNLRSDDARRFDDEVAHRIIQHHLYEMQAEQNKQRHAESQQTFAALVSKSGVIKHESGIAYEILQEGSGEKAVSSNSVTVHYIGKLGDGTEFDNSYQRGEPLDLSLDNVIRGWQVAIPMMSKGAKYRFFIPYDMGYGETGSGPIPPFSTLIFDIELLDFKRNVESDEKI